MISGGFINFIVPLIDKKKQVLSGIIDLCDWRKMHKNQRNIDILEAQALMQRLGFMNGLCEFLVEDSEFEYLCLREAIWNSMYHAEWEIWEKQMEQCAAFNKKNRLYQQFYEEMRCRKMIYDKKEPEEIDLKLKAALDLTKKEYFMGNMANEFLCSSEMRLLELHALVLEKKGNKNEAKAVFDYLISFLEVRCEDNYMKMELLPDIYAVYGAFLGRCKLPEEKKQIVRKGIELLDTYHRNWNRERLKELWLNTREKGKKYAAQNPLQDHYLGIGNGKDICSEVNLLKNISPFSEILYLCRKAVGMTQKEVIGEYCDVAQISRIENGKRVPGQTMRQLFADRIGTDRGNRIYALQMVGYHQIVAQMRVISDIYKNNYKSAKWRLRCLEKSLDMSLDRNRQFIIFATAFVDMKLGKLKKTHGNEAVFTKVKKELSYMIPEHADYKYWPFQIWEFLGVMVCMEAESEEEKRNKIYERIVENYRNRRAWMSRFDWEVNILQKNNG